MMSQVVDPSYFADISDLYKTSNDRLEEADSTGPLSRSQVKERRLRFGLNVLPRPSPCPHWLCCILPCLAKTKKMTRFLEVVPTEAKVLRRVSLSLSTGGFRFSCFGILEENLGLRIYIQIYSDSVDIHILICSAIQILICSDIQIIRFTYIQIFRY